MSVTNITGASQEKLKQFVDRIERLEGEKKELSDDINEVKDEAKSFGFDKKILNKVLNLRKMEADERAQQEAEVDLYMSALEA